MITLSISLPETALLKTCRPILHCSEISLWRLLFLVHFPLHLSPFHSHLCHVQPLCIICHNWCPFHGGQPQFYYGAFLPTIIARLKREALFHFDRCLRLHGVRIHRNYYLYSLYHLAFSLFTFSNKLRFLKNLLPKLCLYGIIFKST